jgi:UPF0755 protein
VEHTPRSNVLAAGVFTLFAGVAIACSGSAEGTGELQRIRVRAGAPFAEVAESLDAKGIVDNTRFFRLYARLTDQATRIRPGTYEFRQNLAWSRVLGDMVHGRVITARLVIPEGMTVVDIAPRIAEIAGVNADSLTGALTDTALAGRFDVPGPGLEGYLYPATYTVPVDAHADSIVAELVRTYKAIWTPERRARADSIGMTEAEVVTLASIIEREAVRHEEMPLISAVYHNRLRIGMPLQADPTVQYALGGHRERLLYADIERVRDHPYNTYGRQGLPPGPIASASERAIDAALQPADSPFLYFVARPDGSHVFSRTLTEHNRAREAIRREQRATGPPIP